MATQFIPPSDWLPSAGHVPQTGPEGTFWRVAGHHGWFLCGPYVAVQDGIYRVKVRAKVEGPAEALSYFDVFDFFPDGRIYAAHMLRGDFEVYVRLYQSSHLEVRFRTEGETLEVHGAEIEPLLLDEELASADELRRLVDRLVAGFAEPPAVFRAIDRLADLGEREEAETRRAQFIAGRRAWRPDAEVWARWLRLHLPGGSTPQQVVSAPVSGEDIERLIRDQPLNVYELYQLTPETRRAVRALGYEALHLNATRLHRDYDEPARIWHERPALTGRVGGFPPRQPLFERYVDIERSYQASMADGRGFPAYCPVSGELLRSKHGFLVPYFQLPFTFYRFEGMETFYVCAGAISNNKLFVYLPRTHTIAWIGDPSYRFYSAEELVRLLNTYMITYAEETGAYLRGETRPASVIGSDNYGHFFWANLSGLQYAVENGLAASLAGMVKVPTQFFPPEELFPELSHLPTRYFEDPAEAFRHCVVEGYLPIHFTDVAMSDALVERLRSLARERATAAAPPPEAPRPLLWLNLRAHNKIWRNQAEGYANILNSVYEDYGSVAALLDGVPDCRGLADEIRARTRPEIPLYDGLSFSLYDKIEWGRRIDAFVSVIGTGLMIVNVMAGASGVAHANHEHLAQMDWWHTILPGTKPPLTPTKEQVVEFGSGLQRDYDLDWRILLELVREVLDPGFGPRSPQVA